MSTTLKGKATLEGISGTVTYTAIVANGALEAINADVTDQADVQPRLNGGGEVQGFRARNHRKEISVTCLATISTGTARADALKAAILPPILSTVTLASFEQATGAGINGDYVYQGGGSIAYGDDWLRITLPLTKWDHETSANLTAAVT
jgi:hypothetical protein